MITIDRTGPDGNVFCILGAAKSVQRQLKKAVGQENETIAEVLRNFTQMTYEDICDKLESTGLFEFVDRGDPDDDYDDEEEDDEEYDN